MSPPPPSQPLDQVSPDNITLYTKLMNILVYGAPGLFIGVFASAMKIAKDRKPLKDMFRTSLLCTGTGFISASMTGNMIDHTNTALYVGMLFTLSFCAEYVLDIIPKLAMWFVDEYLSNTVVAKLLKKEKTNQNQVNTTAPHTHLQPEPEPQPKHKNTTKQKQKKKQNRKGG